MPLPITDPATLARVAELSQSVDAAAAAVADRIAANADARSRRQDLASARLRGDGDLGASHALAEELSDQLAADPSTAAKPGWDAPLTKTRAASHAAVESHGARAGVIDRAIEKIDREIAAGADELQDLKRQHETAWAEFVNGARDALTDTFEERFGEFYAEVLGPLDALNQAPKVYSRDPVYGGPRRSLSPDSKLDMRWPDATPFNFSGWAWHRLYPAQDLDTRAAIADFRAALGAPAAGKRRAARGEPA